MGKSAGSKCFYAIGIGSTHNFIFVELAQRLGIDAEDMGPPLQALGAFEGQQVPVTPLIGKLRLHIQNYFDSEDFFISPLVHQDVILGMPWFHCLYAKIQFPEKIVSFTHNDKEISIKAQHKGVKNRERREKLSNHKHTHTHRQEPLR